jgi:hypothetical protein
VPLGNEDRVFSTFSTTGFDVFETPEGANQPSKVYGSTPKDAVRGCADCHGAPGVTSFNSYLPFRLGSPESVTRARLVPISRATADRVAIAWKEDQPDWRALTARLALASR